MSHGAFQEHITPFLRIFQSSFQETPCCFLGISQVAFQEFASRLLGLSPGDFQEFHVLLSRNSHYVFQAFPHCGCFPGISPLLSRNVSGCFPGISPSLSWNFFCLLFFFIFPACFPGISSKEYLSMISRNSHITFHDFLSFFLGISTLLDRNRPFSFQECPMLLSSHFSCCFLGMP